MSEISIIVPVYKTELYLRRCVDSILNQTFSDFDVILVDDGSPDQCPFICDEYTLRDYRVHTIHQRNSGPSIARNSGIDWAFFQSNSRYIAFVDSDDYLHPQFLEYMYSAIEKNAAEISMCQHKYIAANEKFDKVELYDTCSAREVSAEDLMVEKSSSFNYVWGKLYAKRCFKHLRYPEDVFFGEDNLIIFKAMFECGKIIFVDNELYYYFYTLTGITKSPWTPRSLDVFEGIRVQLNYYAEYGYKKAYKKEIELYIQQYAYQIHRICADKPNFEKNKPYLFEMRKQMKALLRNNDFFKLSDCFYWYEALYPQKAKIFNIVRRIKRNLKEKGVRGILKKINGKLFS